MALRQAPACGDDVCAVRLPRFDRLARLPPAGVLDTLRPEQPRAAALEQLDLVRPRRPREPFAGRLEEGFLAGPQAEELGLPRGRVGQPEQSLDLSRRIEPPRDAVGAPRPPQPASPPPLTLP